MQVRSSTTCFLSGPLSGIEQRQVRSQRTIECDTGRKDIAPEYLQPKAAIRVLISITSSLLALCRDVAQCVR
jgi:hypothetical protein